jgi:hypothetical protein
MRTLAVVVVLVALGCAPSLSTFQPAHVAPKGHVLASGGFEVGVATGSIVDVIDTGKTLSDRAEMGQALSDDDKWRIFDAGVNLLLGGVTVGPHFSVAYSLLDRLELNLRYAGTAWRLGGRYQLLDHNRGPFDMTVGLGVSRFAYEFPISDQIPVLELDDFSRWQFDVPVLIGTSRDFFRVWLGPKLLFTTFTTQLTLKIPGADQTVASFDGTATWVGGQAGVAFGYRHLFVAFELTLAEGFGTAHLSAVNLNPSTHDTSLSSFLIYPSFGIMAEL